MEEVGSGLHLPSDIIDHDYFANYEDLSVHELMLRDTPRQEAYRNAVMRNKYLFKNKIVLDVGAGTGILSIFCAQAGASKVYAVEASNLSSIARNIVIENNVQEIVEVYHCKIEDFELQEPSSKVDIIISEWMGFYLLHEGMLDSVIYARDKFLKNDGLMIPSCATIYISPCSIPSRFSDWENVSGISMKAFAKELRVQKSQNPEILKVEPNHLLHDGVAIAWIDLKEVSLEDVEEFEFKDIVVIEKDGKYDGLCIWFDCNMVPQDTGIILSTSPMLPETHWKQTVIVYPENCCREVERSEPVAFHLVLKKKEDNSRRYDLQLTMLEQENLEHIVPCDCYMTKCILAKAHLVSTMQDEDSLE